MVDSCTQTEWAGGWESVFPFSQNNLLHLDHHYESLETEQDIEYEEVTLCRSQCDEKLGLTLCYTSPDEPETNIFVSEIEPESLAAKDGRIVEGDQLLQVNGVDVRNREQAVALFSSRESEITLLLSRPRMQVDDDDEDEDDHLRLDDFPRELYMIRSGSENLEGRSESSPIVAEKCTSTSTTSLLDTASKVTEGKDDKALSDTSLDKEMAALNKEMQSIQLECESLVSRHIREQWFRQQEPTLPTDICPKRESVAQWVQTLDSAARLSLDSATRLTLDSAARMTLDSAAQRAMDCGPRLTLELAPIPDEAGTNLVDKSTQLCDLPCDTCKYCQLQNLDYWSAAVPRDKQPPKDSSVQGERNKNYVTFYPCATMYTNQENLQHTIWLQQQLFRQALAHKHCKKVTTIPPNAKQWNQKYPSSSLDSMHLPKQTSTLLTAETSDVSLQKSPVDESPMEWKVKRRPDGTRYITRRPVRNKLLKERALQIMEERCGLSTDEEAASELKVGRYWSREERKRHLEKARDRKQRKENLLKTLAAEEGRKKKSSSSKKLPSTPSSTVLDDCPTFAILSVTTV